jgi:hypothetical protein
MSTCNTQIPQGPQGYDGWEPVYALIIDSVNLDVNNDERVVKQLVDWIGGEGPKPVVNIGDYVSGSGFTTDIALATNVRGAKGADGTGGSVTVKNSIEIDAGDLQLVSDLAVLGPDQYYGSDGAGTKGFQDVKVTGGKNSIEVNAREVQLVNDNASPGNNYYYGTDATGTKGYFILPAGGSGEANTTSNSGAGEGLALPKSGVDLPFKSLIAGTNMSFAVAADTITLNAAGGGGGTGYDDNAWQDLSIAPASVITIVSHKKYETGTPAEGTYGITSKSGWIRYKQLGKLFIMAYNLDIDFSGSGSVTSDDIVTIRINSLNDAIQTGYTTSADIISQYGYNEVGGVIAPTDGVPQLGSAYVETTGGGSTDIRFTTGMIMPGSFGTAVAGNCKYRGIIMYELA